MLFFCLLPMAYAQDWVTPPDPSVAVGDVFVAGPAGANILIDGKPTGLSAPNTLSSLPVGPHVIGIRLDCDGVDIPVEVRKGTIERAEAPLSRGPASIAIGVSVPGATVWLDGMILGQAPVAIQHTSCGTHIVEAEAVGFAHGTAEIKLGYGESQPFTLTLSPVEVGNIAVNVRPYDAEIWVDGSLRGVGPLTVNALSVGLHEVTAKAKGFDGGRAPVTVKAGETTRVDLSLVAAKSFAERTGLNRVDWPRVGVGGGLAAVAVGSGVLAATNFLAADAGYENYSLLTYADDPDDFYAANVEQPTVVAYTMTGVATLAAGGSAFLLATLRMRPTTTAFAPVVSATPAGLAVSGTF